MGIFDRFFKNSDDDDNDIENFETEDEPFIKPYDFFIEADERYNDEKTVEVMNIRTLDILKLLDKMDLIHDVKTYFGIRKKLKRLFDDLSTDIDGYASYDGGRSVTGSAYDEIDDKELEITVEIKKPSADAQFIVTVRIGETGKGDA